MYKQFHACDDEIHEKQTPESDVHKKLISISGAHNVHEKQMPESDVHEKLISISGAHNVHEKQMPQLEEASVRTSYASTDVYCSQGTDMNHSEGFSMKRGNSEALAVSGLYY